MTRPDFSAFRIWLRTFRSSPSHMLPANGKPHRHLVALAREIRELGLDVAQLDVTAATATSLIARGLRQRRTRRRRSPAITPP